jgi:hypothetical protein
VKYKCDISLCSFNEFLESDNRNRIFCVSMLIVLIYLMGPILQNVIPFTTLVAWLMRHYKFHNSESAFHKNLKLFPRLLQVNNQVHVHKHTDTFLKLAKFMLKITVSLPLILISS